MLFHFAGRVSRSSDSLRQGRARRLDFEELERREVLTTLPVGFSEVLITDGLVLPTSMAAAPDGRLLVTEGGGHVRVIKNGVLLPTPAIDLHNVFTQGEHGVVGMTLDPNFVVNNYVYLYYTVEDSPVQKHNRVSRFTLSGDVVVPGSELVLLDLEDLNDSFLHNGGSLDFGADGKLYVGVGMNADVTTPQSLDTRLGKILRINADGTIPTDNPFYTTATGVNRSIYALGVRNPFSLDIQPGTGRVFANDVGAATWEEINDIVAGGNYGWPLAEGEVNDPNFDDPVYVYRHGQAHGEGCAITGGAFYNPTTAQFPADHVGDYFFMDFCHGFIQRYDPIEDAVYDFADDVAGNPVQLMVDENGSLYYLSRAEGSLYRIDKPGDFPPSIVFQPVDQAAGLTQSATFQVSASGSGPLSYQWQKDGVDLPGATSAAYTTPPLTAADDGAVYRVNVSNQFGSQISNTATLTVIDSLPPTAQIDAPLAALTYDAGDTINYAGGGDDPEDGGLPASAMTWVVDFHHDEHFHPFLPAVSGSAAGSFVIPTTGETSADVFYRIHLTVEDSHGLTHSTFRDIHPNTSLMTFGADVPGVELTLDGAPLPQPATKEGVVNVQRTLGAASPQVLGGVEYQFVSWSDGGQAVHTISTPAVDTTFTAVFAPRVIDNAQTGYAETGAWQDAPTGGWNGSGVRTTTAAGATASWTPVLAAGRHHVSFYKVAGAGHTSDAQVEVHHAGGATVRSIDLSGGSSGWVYLGEFDFDGAGGEFVRLKNGAGGQLVADAVEFHNGDGLDDGLASYWSFNEGAGATAADTAPTGVEDSGQLEDDAFFTPFGVGGAVNFDGDGDRVSIPDSDDINLENYEQFTIAFSFMADDVGAGTEKQVLYKHGGSGRGLNVYLHDGRLYAGAWNDDEPGWNPTFVSTDQITAHTWHHAAVTINAGDAVEPDGLTAYLDGVSFGVGEATKLRRHAGDIAWGGNSGTTKYHDGDSEVDGGEFAGQIDEARIYHRALPAQEVTFLALAQTPSSADDGLVAHWALDEAAGTIAGDSSTEGQDNTAAVYGDAGWSPYGLSGSLQLDGADDYVRAPDTPDINFSNQPQLTVAMWFRAEDIDEAGRKQVLYTQGGQSRGLGVYLHDGRLYVGAWNEGVAGWDGTYLSTQSVESERWHHVALVLDGDDSLQPGALTAYLDGVAIGSGEAIESKRHAGDVVLGDTVNPVRFHDGVSGLDNGFEGLIDDARVYQRALSPDAVDFLANQLLLTRETGLQTYWSFDEGAGTTAADTAPQGVDDPGTLQNGAAFIALGVDGALALDGDDDHLAVADSGDLNFDKHRQWTIGLWFYAEDVDVAARKQVLYEQGGESRGLSIYLHDGRLYAGAWNLDEGWSGTFLQTSAVESRRWHHVTLMIDGGATLQPDAVSGYLDGQLFGQGQGMEWRRHGGDLAVGRVAANTQFHDGLSQLNGDGLAGWVDELRVYHRPLAPAEIQALAGEQPVALDTGLVAHLDFNEASGTTAADSSPEGVPACSQTVSGSS